MDKSIALEILREHSIQCSEYHKHKETITWTALGLYLAFLTATIGFVASNTFSNGKIVLLIISSVTVCLLVLIFINQQLQWKSYELSAMNSANKVIIEIANGAKNIGEIDCSIPKGEFLPKVILQEMGWDGEKKFKLKNSGAQKYVKVYANLFIVILTIFEIIFLALH